MNARLRAAVDRRLSDEDARAYVDTPIGAAERDEVEALIRWFTRRYPTPAERLAYVRRACARWSAAGSQERDEAVHRVPGRATNATVKGFADQQLHLRPRAVECELDGGDGDFGSGC